MAIYMNNLLTNAAGKDMLNPLVTDIIQQADLSFELKNNIYDKMGYVETRARAQDQMFGITIGAYALPEIVEGQDLPLLPLGHGNRKWFKVRQYGGAIPLTNLFKRWLETASVLDGADSSVQAEFANLRDNTRRLLDSAKKRMNMEATKVVTNGFTNTAFNSSTPYGLSLFNASHPYAEGTQTFRNIMGGSYGTTDKALSALSLQDMLNLHKSGIFLQNGDRIDTPGSWTLMVSRKNAVTARGILNTPGNQVSQFSGTWANPTQINTFYFNGNTVEILENPWLGYVDQKSGEVIGTELQWFLINTEGMKAAKALRKITLQDPQLSTWTNNANKTTVSDVNVMADFIHVGAEYFITGSNGTV